MNVKDVVLNSSFHVSFGGTMSVHLNLVYCVCGDFIGLLKPCQAYGTVLTQSAFHGKFH